LPSGRRQQIAPTSWPTATEVINILDSSSGACTASAQLVKALEIDVAPGR